MTTLTEFLLARIAEDEAAARGASPGPWSHSHEGLQGGEVIRSADDLRVTRVYQTGWPDYLPACENAAHIARHHPARILADCKAKRAAVRECADDLGQREGGLKGRVGRATWDVLTHLAVPYADHPDYRDEWRP